MRVIVRPPGEAFRRALSEHPGRETIDPAVASRQHEAFVAALRAVGVTLVEMPADDELPDACFVSDVLITLPRADDPGGPAAVAVATRPGAPSRRPEVAAVVETARELLGAACRLRVDERLVGMLGQRAAKRLARWSHDHLHEDTAPSSTSPQMLRRRRRGGQHAPGARRRGGRPAPWANDAPAGRRMSRPPGNAGGFDEKFNSCRNRS